MSCYTVTIVHASWQELADTQTWAAVCPTGNLGRLLRSVSMMESADRMSGSILCDVFNLVPDLTCHNGMSCTHGIGGNPPEIACCQLLPKQHRCVADCLLDDP